MRAGDQIIGRFSAFAVIVLNKPRLKPTKQIINPLILHCQPGLQFFTLGGHAVEVNSKHVDGHFRVGLQKLWVSLSH